MIQKKEASFAFSLNQKLLSFCSKIPSDTGPLHSAVVLEQSNLTTLNTLKLLVIEISLPIDAGMGPIYESSRFMHSWWDLIHTIQHIQRVSILSKLKHQST
uniref:Uncharacterized protein n=1 Tax=Lactuca sativa TaxID=4236 RepID=A0A9R1VIZ7_LACSA|nr:hypothetical protein LSAT_V11C500283950 [Lactuca sativa]